jgi:hypothetical protein
MGITYLTGQDEAIIATGFTQLALEGKVSQELKKSDSDRHKKTIAPFTTDHVSRRL